MIKGGSCDAKSVLCVSTRSKLVASHDIDSMTRSHSYITTLAILHRRTTHLCEFLIDLFVMIKESRKEFDPQARVQ